MGDAIKDLDRIIKKLDNIDHDVAKEITPEVDQLFKQSVHSAILNFYNSYQPEDYIRTYNFESILSTTKSFVSGNIITLSVDNNSMNDYPGWFHKSLDKDSAYHFMFMNGEHGHGIFNMAYSIPPYDLIDADIQSMFNGKGKKLMENAQKKILNKIFS